MPASPVGQPSEAAKALFSAFEQAVDAVVITGYRQPDPALQCRGRADVGISPRRSRRPAGQRPRSARRARTSRWSDCGKVSPWIPRAAVKGRREFRISRKDGSEAWGAFSISRVDYAGKTLYINFIRDVTDDVRDREQNALMALVAEKTDRVVMVSKRDMTIVYVNNAFTELFDTRLRKRWANTRGIC